MCFSLECIICSTFQTLKFIDKLTTVNKQPSNENVDYWSIQGTLLIVSCSSKGNLLKTELKKENFKGVSWCGKLAAPSYWGLLSPAHIEIGCL